MADATLVTNPDLTQLLVQLNTLLSQLVQGGSHLVTGGMAAHALQWLKNKPALAKYWTTWSDRTKTIVGALAAALPAAGIVVVFYHPHADVFGIVASNVTPDTVRKFVWSLLQNWLWQQGWYMTVIKAKAVVGPAVTPASNPPANPVPVVVESSKESRS